MSRLQRSPPTTPVTDNKLAQVSSDSDIPQSVASSPFDNVNTSTRHKRPRGVLSPSNELQDFKHEILHMLTKWKSEQESHLKKFLDDQSLSMTKLVSEIAELKSQNTAIQKSNLEIEKTVIFINKQYDDLLKQIDAWRKEKQSYSDTLKLLEFKVQDLQLSTRSSTVEIRNVPPVKEKESMAELTNIVTKLGETVNLPIYTMHIRDIYRLPGKQGSIRPTVTEFTSVHTKLQLLSSVRDFNKKCAKEERLNTQNVGIDGNRRPLYVAEYLPPSSRKLFYTAREFAKQKEYKFCWTSNENVFLRKNEGDKQILIKTEQMLRDLEVKQ